MSVKTTPILAVKNVSLAFDGNVILENINFEVKAGDYLGIIGPNGGGKTTLLKIMLGLLKPQTGQVELQGDNIYKSSNRHQVAYVPQRSASDSYAFPATVAEIVMSGRTANCGLLSMTSKSDVATVKRAMKLVDINYLAHRRVGTLSGGERQRVMIARALASDPMILMLDEPTTFVDAPSQENFYEFLSKLNSQGLTVVMVSHDIDAIAHEVTSVLCLNRHLICHGPAKDILKKSNLEKMYANTPVLHHHH
jgi:zinc transport system ATP-binding protein